MQGKNRKRETQGETETERYSNTGYNKIKETDEEGKEEETDGKGEKMIFIGTLKIRTLAS